MLPLRGTCSSEARLSATVAASVCLSLWSAGPDAAGFVLVDPDLRVVDGPGNVFAVGDVAASASDPRPKAGVFAVRQGPVLAANLRRRGKKPFRNPHRTLGGESCDRVS